MVSSGTFSGRFFLGPSEVFGPCIDYWEMGVGHDISSSWDLAGILTTFRASFCWTSDSGVYRVDFVRHCVVEGLGRRVCLLLPIEGVRVYCPPLRRA